MSQKQTMKRGHIVEVNKNDGIAIVCEESTQTEYILILSEYPKRIKQFLKVNTTILFSRNEKCDQFLVEDFKFENSINYDKAI